MTDTVETKQLIKLNERFLNVAETVKGFKNSVKALKICLKLISFEIKEIKKSKQPIAVEKSEKILWRFFDLRNTVKVLIKTKSIQEISKASADVESMIFVTQKQIAELKAENSIGNISSASQKIVNAIGDTAQKIGDAVNSKIDGLKKMFVGEENSKSE